MGRRAPHDPHCPGDDAALSAFVDTNVLVRHPTGDAPLLLRAIEVYETELIDFAEAYLVACAETTGINRVASFDRSLDRVTKITRVEPPAH